MSTLFVQNDAAVDELLDRRRQLGLDGRDEVREGVYHVAPDDFRVPDLGFHRPHEQPALYYASASLVVEVVSPGEETLAKFSFYAAHGVEELWVIDPLEHSVRIWQLTADRTYVETGDSTLPTVTAAGVTAQPAWPQA